MKIRLLGRGARTGAISLFILAIAYMNVAAILRVCQIRFPQASPGVKGPLPNHWATEDLFYMFGLFGGITDNAVHYQAMGSKNRLPFPPAEPAEQMIDLDIYQYYPQVLGEANRRIGFHSYYNDKQRLREAYRQLALTLADLHNDLYPDNQVEQVFIYVHWWPKSKLGYFDRYDERKTQLKGFS